MSMLQTAALMSLSSLVVSVAAHGHVQGIIAGGIWYDGYSPTFQYDSTPPTVIGWSIPEDLDNGFIDPSNYTTPEIICHLGATPAGASAKVAAGDVIELQWTPWPSSHHGPVLDYLAKCPGSCSDVDKTTLQFFKIDEVGLISDATEPGTWAADQLIANNNSWTVTIPESIAPGNYVLRHEIIALHSAEEANGAQNYPQCINLEITGSGTDAPTGTLGENLYTSDAPGILVNIYTSLSTYRIPGPTLISGAGYMKQTEVSFGSYAPVTSGSVSAYNVPATTIAASSTAVAPTSTSAATLLTFSAVASTPWSTYVASSSTHVAPSTTELAPTSKPSSTSVAAVSTSSSSSTTPSSTSTSSYAAIVTSSASTVLSSSLSRCVQEITTTTTKSAMAANAVYSSSSSTVVSHFQTSLSTPVVSIASTLPSGVSTKTTPTILPTRGAHPTGAVPVFYNHTGLGMPSKPLPPGWTVKDLLEWVAYLLMQVFREEGDHQRDFKRS